MRIKFNSFMLKTLGCFVVVILLVSAAFGVLRAANSYNAEKSALENLEINFKSDAENLQRVVSQIKFAMSELSVKLASDRNFAIGTYLEKNDLRAEMRAILVDRRQNEFSRFLSTAFIIDNRKPEYIYELTGTFTTDVFYNQYYTSDVYNSDFWLREMSEPGTFKIFPAHLFSTARETKRVDVLLMPIAYKPQDESNYVIVMMLDLPLLIEEYDLSGIYSEEREPIYTTEGLSEFSAEQVLDSDGKLGKGYVFKFIDEQNKGMSSVKFVSRSDVNRVKGSAGPGAMLICTMLILAALAFAVMISLRRIFYTEKIFEELSKNPRVKAQYESGIKSFRDFLGAVKLVSLHDSRAISETGRKDSVLDSVFLQSRMRDVYAEIEDIERNIDITRKVFLIYFKVNYKSEFTSCSEADIGKATFFLKQLIEMYLEAWNVSATTFQNEKNGIVSVIDTGEGIIDTRELVSGIVAKLENESEYAFFTVTVSGVCDEAADIKNAYDNLLDLSRFSRTVTETQVLFDGEVKRETSRFYFTVEEMERLSALLQNGTREEVVHKVDEIFEYNIRKDINNFELHLLCTEIINCGVKLVNRILKTVPEFIDLPVIYRSLELESSPSGCREICVDFLGRVMDGLKQNKQGDDYIITYILDYVDNHYSEDIYLNLFAEKLKLTGAYISSYFKAKMNVNLSDYINNYRIKKAIELSKNPQNKNKDIAVMVGLPNINTFIRLFKKYTGSTPGEYRKKHFGDDEHN